MAITTRLILAMAAILCAATIVIGSVAIGAVTNVMTNRIDNQLYEFMDQAVEVVQELSNDTVRSEPAPDAEAVGFQPIALMIYDADGQISLIVQAGYPDDPYPLPQLPDNPARILEPTTVGSADFGIEYRVLARDIAPLIESPVLDDPIIVVAAFPTVEVDAVQRDLIVVMVVTVTAVLALAIAASWWITRRGLRPVTNMIDAAVAVADGDLTRRLPAHSERTEIGKLATALNIMVSKLVDAITQRDSQQARLRTFVADASHELRTPLAAISGYAELYESGGTPAGAPLDRAMSRIRGESHRMAALVDDLLLLARLDQETAPARRPLDLRQLTYDSVDDARAADKERVVTVHAHQPLFVYAHEPRLRQVVNNLLTNARVHTPPATRVTVTVQQRDHEAVLSICDDGPGIPADHRHRVFDRFYRADDSRSRDTGGTGLGLSIVKSIVESHDGRVELESKVDNGTTVRVILPLAPQPPGE